MKLNKKSTKNLVYTSADLSDERYFEEIAKEPKKPKKFVPKMKDRYDQALSRSGGFTNRGGFAY